METTNNTEKTVIEQPSTQTIVITQAEEKNGIGIAGFVLSITGLILCWVPVLKWLLLIPALILSLIGLSRKPKTLAIIGTIVSALVLLVILVLKATVAGAIMSL